MSAALTFQHEDLEFPSHGERCAAWLYRPAPGGGDSEAGPLPLVILAHGFGMVREAGLDAYAERFVAAGFAALVFDYRHFGASGGEPRELLGIERQLEDWRAAVDFGRELDGVDPERVALWGSSFSGGHVAAVAADDPRLAAVISQVPFSGTGKRQGPRRPAYLARLLGSALLDELRGRLGRTPHYIPVSARPGEACLFEVDPEANPLLGLLPEGPHSWRNRFTPRVVLRLGGYRPFERAAEIRVPWLLMVCDRDEATPADRAVERAAAAPDLTLRRYPASHFEIYTGELFETAVAEQIEFLRRALTSPR